MYAPSHTASPIARLDDELTDEQIVERVRAGERPLYELIMRRYNQRLYRIARSITGNDADAEDVLQDAYLSAFTHLDQFRGESKFATWLTRIAVHEATRRRKRARAQDRSIMDHRDPDNTAGARGGKPSQRPERAAENAELRSVLTRAIDRLPAKLRPIVMLREVEGLDTTEAAECLGISESNVRIRLHRAREMLQAEIDRQLGSEIRRLYQFGAEHCDRVVARVMSKLMTM